MGNSSTVPSTISAGSRSGGVEVIVIRVSQLHQVNFKSSGIVRAHGLLGIIEHRRGGGAQRRIPLRPPLLPAARPHLRQSLPPPVNAGTHSTCCDGSPSSGSPSASGCRSRRSRAHWPTCRRVAPPTKRDWQHLSRRWGPRLDAQIETLTLLRNQLSGLHRVRLPLPQDLRAPQPRRRRSRPRQRSALPARRQRRRRHRLRTSRTICGAPMPGSARLRPIMPE